MYQKKKNKNGCNHTLTMTATLFRHFNEQAYKFAMIKQHGFQVKYVFSLLEEKGVWLLSLSRLWSEGIY